jgi:hypothetical protein
MPMEAPTTTPAEAFCTAVPAKARVNAVKIINFFIFRLSQLKYRLLVPTGLFEPLFKTRYE